MTGALGTYAAALIVIAASLGLGGGIAAACGARRWSWTAPAVGLAAATVITWWAVRLPGEGTTALIVLVAGSLAGAGLAARRLEGAGEALARGLPLAVLALAAASIPFVVEGHFGILGTGFNVDMSQHLFAASWLADPATAAPGLYEQGYPLGPHALAVATGELSGDLATAFSGVTIAIPALIALTALGAVRGWGRPRAYLVAGITAFAYLASTYLAQGSFKELFLIAFILGFAIWLGELEDAAGERDRTWAAGLPGAVLAAGALYAYSGPGIAWLAGTLLLWGAVALFRRTEPAGLALRRSLPVAGAAILALLLIAAPELDRIADFGGSVGTVSEASEPAGGDGGGDGGAPRDAAKGPKFDNDLGNLFGQISPLEAFGIWPSGDFRVAPGDGAVPAAAFYAGALLGALALGFGVLAAARRGEVALLAALAAAAAIWLAARIGSTPYTAAKALAMIAPLAALITAKGLLDPAWLGSARDRVGAARTAVAVAVLAGLGVSSGLALANAPVGPSAYSPAVGQLSDRFAGEATLLLAPAKEIDDEHGREFYGWEIREASLPCVAATGSLGTSTPAGLTYVLTVDGEEAPPFDDVERVAGSDGATLWRAEGPAAGSAIAVGEITGTDCAELLAGS